MFIDFIYISFEAFNYIFKWCKLQNVYFTCDI